jgi:hypothetical protein
MHVHFVRSTDSHDAPSRVGLADPGTFPPKSGEIVSHERTTQTSFNLKMVELLYIPFVRYQYLVRDRDQVMAAAAHLLQCSM